jgi:RNA polymerase sigma-70 factor, ECF subfamily
MNDSSPKAPVPDPPERQLEFVRLLNGHHRQLLGYILALVGRRQDAEDILQRTSITMWKKFDTFDLATDFMAWASTVAFYESRNFLRVAGRSKLVFDDELLNVLARERTHDLEQQEERLLALEGCIQTLVNRDRDLIRSFYRDGIDVKSLAEKLGKAPQSLYNRLTMVRKLLAECVRQRVIEGGKA